MDQRPDISAGLTESHRRRRRKRRLVCCEECGAKVGRRHLYTFRGRRLCDECLCPDDRMSATDHLLGCESAAAPAEEIGEG